MTFCKLSLFFNGEIAFLVESSFSRIGYAFDITVLLIGFSTKIGDAGYEVDKDGVENTERYKIMGMIPQFVSTLANNTVLFLGVWLTMQGHFTVGMIMAFQGFLTSFMAPAMTLVSAGQTLQEMRTQMERVDDVMEYPVDKVF